MYVDLNSLVDPDFTIVESARAAATGYSFPSGHTQNIVGNMSCVVLMTKKKKIRIAAIVLAFVLRPLIVKSEEKPFLLWGILFLSLILMVLYWIFITFYGFPADIDAENLHSGTKNAYTLLGLALCIGIRAGLKLPLQTLMPEFPATAIRYFLMVLFAGAIWPLTLLWFARLGKKDS